MAGDEARVLLTGLGVSCFNVYRRLRGSQKFINLGGEDFSGKDLHQIDFSSASLRLAKFRDADLRHASLWATEAFGADFTGADLRDADLFRADCENALFWGAKLQGAKLTGTNLEGAQGVTCQDFERCVSLTRAYRGEGQHNFHIRSLLKGRNFDEWVETMRSSIAFDT